MLLKVLDLLLSGGFIGNMVLQCLCMKTLFFIALGSGISVSQFHAMSKHRSLLEFEDHHLWVKTNPYPKCFAKNIIVKFKLNSVFIVLGNFSLRKSFVFCQNEISVFSLKIT